MHTQGPWICWKYGDGDYGVQAPGLVGIATVTDLIGETEANAHLIAAAPELLAALKDLIANASGQAKSCGHDYDCVCVWEKAKASIAKAEGR